jgi:very-short-patch-repair endonuclease
MASVAELLERSRKSLLDLSTRNRLLNVPAHGRSARTVDMHDERTAELWRILVDEQKDMSFLPAPEPEPGAGDAAAPALAQPEDDAEPKEVRAHHSDKRLQTRLPSDKLQRRLLDMFYDARTFIEEQGVNVLYLALGQLRWFEAGAAETARHAPLVLLPVKLERRSAAERFYLSWLGEEAQENLSLAAKLKADFGIVLPEFRAGDEFDPTAYIAAVGEAVRGQAGWEVRPDAIVLGFFSFAKFLMYRDLDPANWPAAERIDENRFVAALLRDGFPAAEHPIPDDPGFDFDAAIPAARLTHVLDADAYQAIAIEAARQGRDLVIQGPPGTGKSQTIANLIAAAVAHGMTVLFVAEKLAALEVVKRRLDREGLGDVALELHSNKTQKRAVLEEIKRVLERGRLKAPETAGLIERLEALRGALNAHAALMNEVLAPSGLSVQRMLGRLVRLGDAVPRYGALPLEVPETWTPDDLARRRALAKDLAERIARHGPPARHPWRGVRRESLLRIDVDRLLPRLGEAETALADARGRGEALARRLARPVAAETAEAERLAALAEQVAAAPPADAAGLAAPAWDGSFDALAEVAGEGARLRAALARLGGRVAEAAWTVDFAPVRMAVAAHGRSLLRIFNGAYRRAFATFRAALAAPPPKVHAERVALLDDMVAVQAARRTLADGAAAAAQAFGALWAGERTDWDAAARIVAWVGATRALDLGEPARLVAARTPDRAGLVEQAQALRQSMQRALGLLGAIAAELDLDLGAAFASGAADAAAVPLPAWQERLAAWRAEPERLLEWIAYAGQARAARAGGLGALVERLEAGELPAEEAGAALDSAYHEALLRHAAARQPALASFDGEAHGRIVEEFRAADRRRIELARIETLLAHARGLPAGAGVGAIGVLRGEIEKKRNHLPLRRLFKAAGPAIQAIKPVCMMSPLSIAQYLEPGAMKFDLLLIDEASQVEPVDALGAVARAGQIVVVGDDKQLPPTRFFLRMTSEEPAERADEELAEAADVESVLGLCVARGLPQAMLRWHYRSRHHSLIAVSNRRFYENKLFIVPSPHFDGGELGVKLHHVAEGVFDRGGTAQNKAEARAVAEAAMRHAAARPELSLGVAAFSLKQAQAIRDELELLRRRHQDLEPFFHAHPHEPFFVKNLENVQGDERDVIFISVGYARDASGYMTMSFGPLNAEGGERRLNVLISRAKRRCEVFSSIRAEDIVLERAQGAGVAALKQFLHFAETGRLEGAAASGREADSPFEEAVQAALERAGLDVRRQVGIAGFFVDLAIVDPERPGRFLLGIECDGAAYHSCRAARDRDRLRQQVLEDHGWRIHRIWSTDWFNRPQRELDKVLRALEAARAERAPEPAPEPPRQLTIAFERVDGRGGLGDAPPYREASFPVPSHIEPHALPPAAMVEIVGKIVAAEGPIHADEIVARVRMLWGLARAGSRIQRAVAEALEGLRARPAYLERDGFWRLGAAAVVARDRSAARSAGLRKSEMLPPEEIQAAALDILRASAGATRRELPPAVARRLGFAATGAALRERIDAATDALVAEGAASEQSGLVVAAEAPAAERAAAR